MTSNFQAEAVAAYAASLKVETVDQLLDELVNSTAKYVSAEPFSDMYYVGREEKKMIRAELKRRFEGAVAAVETIRTMLDGDERPNWCAKHEGYVTDHTHYSNGDCVEKS